MLEYIFKSILITSLIGTAAALFLTIIKPVTRKFFSSKWNYYVWLVVLIAMLIPFRFTEPANTQQNEIHTFYSPIQEFAQEDASGTDKETGNTPASIIETLKLFAESQMNIFAMIWLLGMAFFLLSRIIGYCLFLIKLRKCTDVISCPELQQFTDKKITTRVSDSFSSPLMVGIFRPTLLLPKASMTNEQLNNVLSHEMTHFKRKDILYKWLVCLVKCIHWFNPAVYYVSKQVNIECEISCDMEVVKDMSEEQETRYIDTIITLLAAGNKRPATITTGMVSDKKTLQRRFTMIKNKIKISKKAMVISVVLLLAIVGGTVFASGIINGKLIDEPENEVVQTINDDPVLKEKSVENGTITYNEESDEVISVVSEPKLVPDNHNESNLRSEPKLTDTITQTGKETNTSDAVLQEISVDEDLANPCKGQISMSFGKREHPITKEVQEHNGIDIKAPEGTDVVSSISGTVTDVGFDSEKGNYIVVERDNIKTVYSQLATTNVKKGDSITARQSIGTVGKTGRATGAHLHFEVLIDGEYCDPSSLIK